MKRRWSNNGGFTALRMLEESSSEVTSSSNGLVLSTELDMSPSSLDSTVYGGEQELWLCNDSASQYNSNPHSVITSIHGCTTLPAQTTIIPLPALPNSNSNSSTAQNYTNGHNNSNMVSAGNGVVPGMTSLNGHNSHHSNSSHHMNGGGPVGATGLTQHQLSVAIHQSLQNGHSMQMTTNNGLHSLSNGLQHHHMNNGNNSMLHHTPRSESVNSISSGKWEEISEKKRIKTTCSPKGIVKLKINK